MTSKDVRRVSSGAHQVQRREKVREANRRYRQTHKEELRESERDYRLRNHDRILARDKIIRQTEPCRTYRREWGLVHYANPVNRMKRLTFNAIERAKKNGRDFDESLADGLMADPPQVCACCSRPLDYSTGRGNTNRDQSPSLDRFDNTKGYTIENVRVICVRCNTIKGFGNLADLEQVLAYLRRG